MKPKTKRPFLGAWSPAVLHYLVQLGPKRKGLSAKTAWLALIISSYSRNNGCFARDETLARKLNVGLKQFGNLVKELKSIGLLTERTKNNIRIFRIDWESKKVWEGIRQGNKFPINGNKFPERENEIEKNSPKNGDANGIGNPRDKYIEKHLEYPKKRKGLPSLPSVNGFHQTLPKKPKKTRFDSRDIDLARRFVRKNSKMEGKGNTLFSEKELLPKASEFAKMAREYGREGYRRIERFLSEWERGGTTFRTLSCLDHFRRSMIIWEEIELKKNPQMNNRSETKHLGNGCTKTSVYLGDLEEGETPVRGARIDFEEEI